MTDTLEVFTDFEQGSGEWETARRGLLTASVMKHFITPKTLKVAANGDQRAMAMQLITERITGWTEENYESYDMHMGHINEPHARAAYAQHFEPVTEVAFMIRTRRGVRVGYSPDGLVGSEGLLEIKCPKPKIHVATIVDDKIPDEHMGQLQTGLWVSGRKWIDFVSHVGGMPLYVKRVFPDPLWQQAITDAAVAFAGTALLVTDSYMKASAGMPSTERIPELEEMRL